MADWKWYRHGVLQSMPEEEVRCAHDGWRIRNCDRGAMVTLIDQLWAEIDRLRGIIAEHKAAEMRNYLAGRKSP